MAPNFSKNAILTGVIDFFCLPCEAYLTTIKEIEDHINIESHINNLILIQNVCEIEDEYIKKVKSKYFCQLCNKVFSVLTRVRLHINEPLHIENKLSTVIKRLQEHITVFNKLAVTDNAWNGLQDGSCLICCVEYEVGVENDHKLLPSHIINLIEKKLEIDENQNVYRKIDEVTFQCLTCDTILSIKSMTQHFISNNHKTSYQASYDLYNKITKNVCEGSLEENNVNMQSNEIEDIERPEAITDNIVQDDPDLEQLDSSPLPDRDLEERQSEIAKVLDIIATANADDEKETNEDDSNEYDLTAEKRVRKVLNSNAYITKDINNKPWCIICDWKLENSSVIDHIESRHHNELQILHLGHLQEMKDKQMKKYLQRKEKYARINKLKIFNDLTRLRDNQIRICYEDETAFCNKCSLVLPFLHSIIKLHIQDHDTKKSILELTEKNEDELTGLINKTVSLLNEEGSLPKNETGIKTCQNKEKDNNEIHNAYPEITNEGKLEKVSTYIYVDSIIPFCNMIFKDFVINNKFCINQWSYCFIVHLSGKVTAKCVVCSEDFPSSGFQSHIMESKHKSIMRDTMVIDIESEFVREVRPCYYQCGYCNVYDTSWKSMLIHLQSNNHKESKTNSLWRLQQYEIEVANGTFKTSDEDQMDLTN